MKGFYTSSGISPKSFYLNSANSVTKNIFVITGKGLKPGTSCVRDQDSTTAATRHIWEAWSLKWAQFMLEWLSGSLNSLNSVKVLLLLGITPLCHAYVMDSTLSPRCQIFCCTLDSWQFDNVCLDRKKCAHWKRKGRQFTLVTPVLVRFSNFCIPIWTYSKLLLHANFKISLFNLLTMDSTWGKT